MVRARSFEYDPQTDMITIDGVALSGELVAEFLRLGRPRTITVYRKGDKVYYEEGQVFVPPDRWEDEPNQRTPAQLMAVVARAVAASLPEHTIEVRGGESRLDFVLNGLPTNVFLSGATGIVELYKVHGEDGLASLAAHLKKELEFAHRRRLYPDESWVESSRAVYPGSRPLAVSEEQPTYMTMEDAVRALDKLDSVDSWIKKTVNQMRLALNEKRGHG